MLHRPAVLLATILAVAAFILASAGVYLVNDLVDLDLDRAHPRRRLRPIAAGEVPLPVARLAAVILLLCGSLVAFAVRPWVGLVVVVYAVCSVAYSIRLKREPVVELVLVSSGFLLRAVAGGAATGVPLSRWFVLTAGFAALFVVAGKRYAELVLVERTGRLTRPVLSAYSGTYLRFVWTLCGAAVLVTYAQWAFSMAPAAGSMWSVLSTVPFVVGLLRYALELDRGDTGEPEEVVLRDPLLVSLGILWLVCLVLSVYHG
jgi:decaprenyl-phosphate phosphoribosyltransferase